MSDIMRHVGRKLRFYRQSRGMTQEELADIEIRYHQEEQDFASLCYTLISEKSREDQERLYRILREIERLS